MESIFLLLKYNIVWNLWKEENSKRWTELIVFQIKHLLIFNWVKIWIFNCKIYLLFFIFIIFSALLSLLFPFFVIYLSLFLFFFCTLHMLPTDKFGKILLTSQYICLFFHQCTSLFFFPSLSSLTLSFFRFKKCIKFATFLLTMFIFVIAY